jgi:hypothetical protein
MLYLAASIVCGNGPGAGIASPPVGRASGGCGLLAVAPYFPDQEQRRVQILNVGCVPWPEPADRSPVRRFPDSQNLTEVFYWWNTGAHLITDLFH